jgi:ABC-2 type transport system ATP-binding protein
MNAVQIDGITKRYGDHTAVDDLSLAIPKGTIFGLLGPNGAGKTTTIRMVNDIIAPDAGKITLLGSLAPGLEAARKIGYLPEERGLYPRMLVLDVLVFFGELRGVPRAEATARAERWLDRLELGGWKKHKVQDLSKGMQQKVQFVTAVIHDPELLILDEPWSGLDPINADVLRDIVLEQKKAGKTVVFSTHQMEGAEQVCDEVCIIARGKKILSGAVAKLKREAARDRTVAVTFAGVEDRQKASAIITDAALVANVREQPTHVELDLAAGAVSQALLDRLVGEKIGLRRFELIEPSLHQIFVDGVKAQEAARG